MFVSAIELASGFTRPIHSIARFYGSTSIVPGAATLFFVNPDGWAITCGHVARQLLAADHMIAAFEAFKLERSALTSHKKRGAALRKLETRYGYNVEAVVELYSLFVGCIEGPLNAEVMLHPDLDMALVKFHGFTRLLCTAFPVFASDGTQLKQGRFLCRLGYPFPEFNNYEHDPVSDRIRWTATGRQATPRFPIEGMVTRQLLNGAGAIVGFELSTPGLRGQSGGPAFDSEGRVWGLQAATAHLDLDFDVDAEVQRGRNRKRITANSFLHVGHCLEVEVIKRFMREKGVSFREG
ncbi:MAG: trypsin-like peptidase domain-containing protein [Deltaproteobacteria bacterium]|nr:trypsin-like peptidase domain-containing protein [Deltaproteobacteria bacterium]